MLQCHIRRIWWRRLWWSRRSRRRHQSLQRSTAGCWLSTRRNRGSCRRQVTYLLCTLHTYRLTNTHTHTGQNNTDTYGQTYPDSDTWTNTTFNQPVNPYPWATGDPMSDRYLLLTSFMDKIVAAAKHVSAKDDASASDALQVAIGLLEPIFDSCHMCVLGIHMWLMLTFSLVLCKSYTILRSHMVAEEVVHKAHPDRKHDVAVHMLHRLNTAEKHYRCLRHLPSCAKCHRTCLTYFSLDPVNIFCTVISCIVHC